MCDFQRPTSVSAWNRAVLRLAPLYIINDMSNMQLVEGGNSLCVWLVVRLHSLMSTISAAPHILITDGCSLLVSQDPCWDWRMWVDNISITLIWWQLFVGIGLGIVNCFAPDIRLWLLLGYLDEIRRRGFWGRQEYLSEWLGYCFDVVLPQSIKPYVPSVLSSPLAAISIRPEEYKGIYLRCIYKNIRMVTGGWLSTNRNMLTYVFFDKASS